MKTIQEEIEINKAAEAAALLEREKNERAKALSEKKKSQVTTWEFPLQRGYFSGTSSKEKNMQEEIKIHVLKEQGKKPLEWFEVTFEGLHEHATLRGYYFAKRRHFIVSPKGGDILHIWGSMNPIVWSNLWNGKPVPYEWTNLDGRRMIAIVK